MTRVQSVIGDFDMLNSWFAITFHAARLAFEAQNAMAFRDMRLIGDASKPRLVTWPMSSPTRSPSRQMFRRPRRILRQTVAEGVSQLTRSTKNECVRTSANAPNNRQCRVEKRAPQVIRPLTISPTFPT